MMVTMWGLGVFGVRILEPSRDMSGSERPSEHYVYVHRR